MQLLLPEAPEPAIPLEPGHPDLQTNYPRSYEMRLTSDQGSSKTRNLYAFRERMEGGDEDDDDDDSEVEETNAKAKGEEEKKSKGRREYYCRH
jgi:transcription initiation factor TFIIF subunit beta